MHLGLVQWAFESLKTWYQKVNFRSNGLERCLTSSLSHSCLHWLWACVQGAFCVMGAPSELRLCWWGLIVFMKQTQINTLLLSSLFCQLLQYFRTLLSWISIHRSRAEDRDSCVSDLSRKCSQEKSVRKWRKQIRQGQKLSKAVVSAEKQPQADLTGLH